MVAMLLRCSSARQGVYLSPGSTETAVCMLTYSSLAGAISVAPGLPEFLELSLPADMHRGALAQLLYSLAWYSHYCAVSAAVPR